MTTAKPRVVILASDRGELTQICGVSLLERLLRILQRIGFSEAIIFAANPEKIRAAIEPPSWARSGLHAAVLPASELQNRNRLLFIPAHLYCDARLLRALAECTGSTALVDSAPPERVERLLEHCTHMSRGRFSGAALLESGVVASVEAIESGGIAVLDAAKQPTYITGMRRHIRPVFFPAPPPELRRDAERIVLDTAQNGTLDIPAILQSPVEDWIMKRLWRTRLTPNQITAFGLFVALTATVLFATGHLWWGMIPALAIGVIDGLDGKQARVKIETSESGEWEHVLDFFFETSWWAALAFWFHRSAELPSGWICFLTIVGAQGLDQLAKRAAKIRTGRLLDDLTPFDRFVRRIGARRDIYIWSLAIGLAFGVPAQTYLFCAIWGVLTAAVHTVRAVMIRS